eukprot:gene26335-31813_t
MLWGPAMNKEYSYSYRFLMIFLSGVMKQMVNLNYNISDVRHLLEHDLLDPAVVSNKTGVPQTSCTIM